MAGSKVIRCASCCHKENDSPTPKPAQPCSRTSCFCGGFLAPPVGKQIHSFDDLNSALSIEFATVTYYSMPTSVWGQMMPIPSCVTCHSTIPLLI